MADVENQQESSFPVKRKSDIYCQDQDNVANKAQKLHASSNSAESESKEGEITKTDLPNLNSSTEEKIGDESSISMEKVVVAGSTVESDANGVTDDLGADEKREAGDDDDNDDDEEEEEDDEEEEPDRKGKGISRADKGKGKLIEEDESDDEDDSDDGDEGIDEENESDLSDDPLAEVDLDNILPSRTRRRSVQPGVYISNEINNRIDEDDEDSSDDSDA